MTPTYGIDRKPCIHCGESAMVRDVCTSCGTSKGGVTFVARQSLAKAKKKQQKCKHKEKRQMPDDYTGGLGFHVERCLNCGMEIRSAAA